MSYLEIDQAKISILGKNILKTVYKKGSIFNSLHLEKIRKAYTTLHGNEDLKDLLLLVVFEGDIDISQDVGETYLTSRIRIKKGEAFVSKNERTREFLNAAAAYIPTNHPIGVFADEKEGLDWLKTL